MADDITFLALFLSDLGAFGHPMASNIQKSMSADKTLYVFDIVHASCKRFQNGFGGIGPVRIIESPKEAVSAAAIVVSFVPNNNGTSTRVKEPMVTDHLKRQATPWLIAGHKLLVPLFRTAEEAREIVKAAKFPPQGPRGFGSPYAVEHFSPMPMMTGYLQQANSSLLTIVQIETQEALDNFDEVAGVDGIDVLFVGPFDLGNNIGHPIYQGIVKPELSEAVGRVLEVSHKFGQKCGIYSTSGKQARQYVETWFDMIHVATDFKSVQFIMTQEVNIAKGIEGTEKGGSY
ncbi:2 4-dihydroxyhept-2-ene-1 7-dioic acid aldolase [Fusarium mundagurra]|uniref:2 4-dihydroxyhept-2-ene-1 7-dioic acid aldolase n=1 Tax=Fusarium mundagurra TaxID=1567541 RepID=A0A8H5XRF5_9HYPO|nr:2 4-dihydroxyhept-2-ene-1 7-dioic acid aldolase [Fusarium mundagurra]